MAVSPQILARIADPTAGKLESIGKNYLKAKQVGIENARADEKLNEAKKTALLTRQIKEQELAAGEVDALLDNSKILSGVTSQFIQDASKNPDIATDPKAYNQWMTETTKDLPDEVTSQFQGILPNQIPQINRRANRMVGVLSEQKDSPETFSDFAKIPNTELYGQRSSKTGKYVNVKDSADGKTSLGGSEFERHLSYLKENKLITQETYDDRVKQRAKGFAGEMTGAGKERLNEKQTDRYNKETKALREEYTKGAAHFKGMSESIEGAFAAIDSGNTKLSEILLNQVMSQVQDTDVRAFQMYGEFDKEFGNLAQRISGKLSRFFSGTRTEAEKQEIISVLTKFNESYIKPANDKIKTRYRELAIQQGKDPFDVVPPANVEDIKNSKLLGKKEKIKMIKSFFPDWKP